MYYAILSLVFLAGASVFTDYSHNIELNSSELTDSEIDKGGLFGTGVSFGRFFAFVGFGIGLPSDTPAFFSVVFAFWQIMVLIFTVGFIIDSIWSG